jgi:hypothetical protein
VLTADFLKRAIVELEVRAGKDMTLPRNKGWMMAFLEREGKEILQMDAAETFAETVYNYWKNRREELRFPTPTSTITCWPSGPDNGRSVRCAGPTASSRTRLYRSSTRSSTLR